MDNLEVISTEELHSINGGDFWRDVAVGGGTLLGSSFGRIGGFVWSLAGGALYDALTD